MSSSSLALPLTIEFVFLAALTAVFATRGTAGESRWWLVRVLFLAVSIRLVMLLAVHSLASPYFFAPDTASYYALGQAVSSHWTYGTPMPEAATGWQSGYPLLNGWLYGALGDPELALSILNLFAGVWTVVLAFHIGRDLMGEAVGRIAAGLTAVFPSLALWSVLNIRDALTTLLVTLVVFLAIRAVRRGATLQRGLAIVAVLLILSTLRDYMTLLMILAILVGTVAVLQRRNAGRSLVLGTILALFLVIAVRQLDLFGDLLVDDPLETAAGLRRGLQTGGAAFGESYEVNSIGGALRYLPVGMAYFLFAPFPWQIESVLQIVALPEVMLWYLIFPLTVWGIRYGVTRGIRPNMMPITVLLVILTSYTLIQGNFGTAYRHRSQVMPLFFIYSGAGLVLLRASWQRRRGRGRAPRHPVRTPDREGR